MSEQEIKARIKAIEYILENALYDPDVEEEIEQELIQLTEQLEDNFTVTEVKDNVTDPAHYKIGMDVYDKIAKNKDAYQGFLHLNATKYLHRVWHKHDTPHDDLNKAVWYINKLLEDINES